MKVQFKLSEIKKISQRILKKIIKLKKTQARVVVLSGDLGAGKTTLTQALALEFGINDRIISPTFVIMKIYPIDSKSIYFEHFKKLIHIDAYRLEDEDELLKIGWIKLRADPDNLILLEWPEKVAACLDDNKLLIKLEHIDEQTRLCEF